ncbi:molybdopterin synthase catalytic subunit, partial [Striga asiatica]
FVQSPQCGAIATFFGTTRDTFDGKTVLELRYEAYIPMAIRCIKSICTSARASWALHSMVVAHRVGPAPVGEVSVFVAVSSVHRSDSLDACKFVIDEVKASVPIWKKEVYANGEYIDFVQSPQCGAIATFFGTTRDTFDGKTVLELRYEAYIPMAIRCIKSICTSARASWALHSMVVAHRVGPVPVGEVSVFVAVSSVHRSDSLDACKFVIDEVKASVPIWKKEVYANGEVWKENS